MEVEIGSRQTGGTVERENDSVEEDDHVNGQQPRLAKQRAEESLVGELIGSLCVVNLIVISRNVKSEEGKVV